MDEKPKKPAAQPKKPAPARTAVKPAAAPAPGASTSLRVRATRTVFAYGHRVRPGVVFTLKRAEDFHPESMQWVDAATPDQLAQRQTEAAKGRSLDGAEQVARAGLETSVDAGLPRLTDPETDEAPATGAANVLGE